jgi:hypothetical protein
MTFNLGILAMEDGANFQSRLWRDCPATFLGIRPPVHGEPVQGEPVWADYPALMRRTTETGLGQDRTQSNAYALFFAKPE